ncbi:MAG: hypothetical protein ACK5P6_02015 [Pseudobdellovibrionaceae bacterium]
MEAGGEINKEVNPKDIKHVFLGRGDKQEQKIVLLSPFHTDFNTVRCEIFENDQLVETVDANPRDPVLRDFIFEFSNLIDGHTYSYRFTNDRNPIELGGGLEEKHLQFKYWKTFTKSSEFLLLSCNGVDYYKDKKSKWNMWTNALQTVQHNRDIGLLVLAGDQYYQDKIEEKWIDLLDDSLSEDSHSRFLLDSIESVFRQTSHLSYRILMAQYSSVAMLDDHDITDGAGGRAEFFEGVEFTKNWRKYSSAQIRVFEAFQGSRNPSPIKKTNGSGFSFQISLGKSKLIALDLRTEKNSKKNQLMSDDQKDAVFKEIEISTEKVVYLLLPVVPIRNAIKLEGVLTAVSMISRLLMKIKILSFLDPKVFQGIKFIADMEDDLRDALSSENNVKFLAELFRRMILKNKDDGTKFVILSGDIHTAGSVEVIISYQSNYLKFPILIASPIGYQTMSQHVEAALRESAEISFEESGVKIRANNNAFYTNRNFMVINPGSILENDPYAVRLYQEGVSGYKLIQYDSWKLVDFAKTSRVESLEASQKENKAEYVEAN